jgi:hypothetical protein
VPDEIIAADWIEDELDTSSKKPAGQNAGLQSRFVAKAPILAAVIFLNPRDQSDLNGSI